MLTFLFSKTPLFFLVQDFWRDEAYSYTLSIRSLPDILSLTVLDFSPPLYYLVLHVWMKIFGTSEIAIRSLSFLFYFSTVLVVYYLLKDVFKLSFKSSIFYTFFVVVSPILVYFAFEARMYSMLAFLAALSSYLYLKKRWGWYILVTTLGLYTHYFMIIIVAVQIFHTFITNPLKKSLLKSVLPIILFFPWLIYLINSKNPTSEPFWIKQLTLADTFNLPGYLYTGYETSFAFYDRSIFVISLLFLIISALAVFLYLKDRQVKKDRSFIYVALWMFLPPFSIFLVSFVKPLWIPRYLIFSSLALVLFTIYVLRRLPATAKVILILFFFLLTFHYQILQIENRKKDHFKKVVKEIRSLSNDQDLLYVQNELDYFTAVYYFGEERVFIYNKPYDEIRNFVGKVLIPESKVTSTLPLYPKKVFILKHDLTYEIKSG